MIYDAVEFFERNIFPGIDRRMPETGHATKHIPLREIINLHNHDGIKSLAQIRSMARQISSGRHVLSHTGLPNIRLVMGRDGSWILFDGHHSMLAYMLSGRKYLHEVPHVIVENMGKRHVTSREISVFFGQHAGRLLGEWKKYVINWQAPAREQLCRRIQKNMGELLDSLNLKS